MDTIVDVVLVLLTFVTGAALFIFLTLGEKAPHVLTSADKIFAFTITGAWVCLALITIIRLWP